MNRKWKFTGFVLASALLLGSTGTFLVGCKDYDDDISHLQQQIDANKKAIEGIEAQIKAGAILTKVESDGAGGVKVTLSNGPTKLYPFSPLSYVSISQFTSFPFFFLHSITHNPHPSYFQLFPLY